MARRSAATLRERVVAHFILATAFQCYLHAAKHGDLRYVQRFVGLLPPCQFSLELLKWFREFSPICISWKVEPKGVPTLVRKGQRGYRPFRSAEAAEALQRLLGSGIQLPRELRTGRDIARSVEVIGIVRRAPDEAYNSMLELSSVVLASSLQDFAPGDIVSLYRGCLRAILVGKRPRGPLSSLLRAIVAHWQVRRPVIADTEIFPWPSTEAPGGDGSLTGTFCRSAGMLSFVGYRVGATAGKPNGERRLILSGVFSFPLLPVFDAPYMSEWGAPASSKRLRKIAETIAALARNAKRRRGQNLEAAISHWESDLDFLHESYYVGRFGFEWPEIIDLAAVTEHFMRPLSAA